MARLHEATVACRVWADPRAWKLYQIRVHGGECIQRDRRSIVQAASLLTVSQPWTNLGRDRPFQLRCQHTRSQEKDERKSALWMWQAFRACQLEQAGAWHAPGQSECRLTHSEMHGSQKVWPHGSMNGSR